MENIINLTQHPASEDQVAAGVIGVSNVEALKNLLTFNTLPTKAEINEVAAKLAVMAKESGCSKAMIGGAPYLMGPLESALKSVGITPLYSFSERVSIEKTVNGEVIKTSSFKHIGWVEA